MQTVAAVFHTDARLFDWGVVSEVFGHRPHPGERVPSFELRRVAVGARPVRMADGTTVQPTDGLAGLADADIVVVLGSESPHETRPPSLLRALRRSHERGATVVSLCAGAFVLAQAGLLDGRRATTHWALAPTLARDYPAVHVDPDGLFVQEDRVWTSAGTAAGIDLCLELVRRDHGAVVAGRVARRLVMAPHRAGGQAQFIERPVAVVPADPIGPTLDWARAHLDRPLSVADLAAHACLSRRTFLRRFAAATGTTPLRWLTHERVLLAQELLEGGAFGVEQVARRAGLGSAEAMRVQFRRAVGTTPSQYAAAFRRT